MRKRLAFTSVATLFTASLFTAAPAFAQPTTQPSDSSTPPSTSPAATLNQSAAPTEPQGSTPPASSSGPSTNTGVQLSTLKLMLDKGMISQAEYDSAMGDLKESVGSTVAPDASTVMFGKWATTFYGFVETDYAYDSTESFTEFPANGHVARPGTYAGDHGRSQISIRNTRLGFRMKAPEYHGIRASAQIEADFLGNQPAVNYAGAVGTGSENAFFNNPTFRVRHANLRLETPVVDVLFGQYWELFGWQSAYHPNTVEIQGVPGQVYSRTAQLRISKTVKSKAINFEAAVAALRPPQRDSATPEGQAGLRFSSDAWSGYHTSGSTGSAIQPISIAVTGDLRNYSVETFSEGNTNAGSINHANKVTSAIAIDAYIPIIPASVGHKGNSFNIYGEFTTGYGDADVFSGLNAGLANASHTTGTGAAATTAAYTSNVDPGLVVIDNAGGLHAVQYTTGYVGAEYYLPGTDGKYWVSGNYSHLTSANAHYYTGAGYAKATAVISDTDWFDANLFGDITPAGVSASSTRTSTTSTSTVATPSTTGSRCRRSTSSDSRGATFGRVARIMTGQLGAALRSRPEVVSPPSSPSATSCDARRGGPEPRDKCDLCG